MTSHPTITLTPAAQRWAIDHGGVITLRHSTRHGCCGGSARVPVAELGEPGKPEEYLEADVDGVHVFHPRDLATNDGCAMTIDLAGLWRWRRLVVEGLEIATGHEKKG